MQQKNGQRPIRQEVQATAQDQTAAAAAESQGDLITINRLTIDFGQNSVLHDLDLTIKAGQTLAIVGESGSGKSLTALSLLQLLPAHAKLSGEILLKARRPTRGSDPQAEKQPASSNRSANSPIARDKTVSPQIDDGRELSSLDLTGLDIQQMEKIRGAQIAMIFQEPMTSLNPVKSCGAQVAEAITAHRQLDAATAKAQVIQLFTEVQLPDPAQIFDKYPHQISGGQKQRVMIAMAMSCSPRLLICDEPTTALDVMVQKEILLLIKDLQRKNNMSVLFISHDIQLVAEIADQIAVLYRGDLVEFGKAGDILSNPGHPYTRALLSCRPGLYERGQRLPVVSDFLSEGDKVVAPDKFEDIAREVAIEVAIEVAREAATEAGADDGIDKANTQISEKTRLSFCEENSDAITAAYKDNEHKDNNNAILQIRDLNVWYPIKRDFFGNTTQYFKAVKTVSLDVNKGETLGLVGGSGCGKTTLGRAIMGLTPIYDGSINFKGRPLVNNKSGHHRPLATEMQMIFQDPYSALNPRLTVGHAIAEALMVHGKKSGKYTGKNARTAIKNKVCQWLERVGLQSTHYDRYPHEFSGGQRQRLVIARAMILEPDFVICDESVSALDVSVQAQILNLFNDLKADLGFSAIFISHDLSVVRYISDRIAVMNQGQLEELGPADEVYYHPQSDYTKALLAAIPAPVFST